MHSLAAFITDIRTEAIIQSVPHRSRKENAQLLLWTLTGTFRTQICFGSDPQFNPSLRLPVSFWTWTAVNYYMRTSWGADKNVAQQAKKIGSSHYLATQEVSFHWNKTATTESQQWYMCDIEPKQVRWKADRTHILHFVCTFFNFQCIFVISVMMHFIIVNGVY